MNQDQKWRMVNEIEWKKAKRRKKAETFTDSTHIHQMDTVKQFMIRLNKSENAFKFVNVIFCHETLSTLHFWQLFLNIKTVAV